MNQQGTGQNAFRAETAISAGMDKENQCCTGTAPPAGRSTMEGLLFLVLWIGCAVLHTLYDIKVRPLLQTWRREEDFS